VKNQVYSLTFVTDYFFEGKRKKN